MFDDVTSMLERKFGCHSFVLYGSHASQQANAASDVDICAFRPASEEIRCSKLWNTHLLDVWIYPDHNLEQSSLKFIRLRNGVVLKEKDGIATRCIDFARKRFAQGPPEIPEWDIEVKKVWIEKTLVRIQAYDPESNYRRAWLLCSLLENYFEFRNLWYLGPKESMSWLQQNDPAAYALFSKSLTPGAPLAEIENLAVHVLANNID
jgi:predicted nucleotidyltransferase